MTTNPRRATALAALASLALCFLASFAGAATVPSPVRWSRKNNSYTATRWDSSVEMNATGGNRVVTLPANAPKGTMLTIVKSDATANTVTITPSGTDTIAGAASYVLGTQYTTASLWYNGAGEWYNMSTCSADSIAGDVNLTGALAVAGNVSINTNKLTVAAASGNTLIAGTLAVTGAQTMTGATYANGGLDRSAAAGLAIGATNATSVTITPATTITGALTCSSTASVAGDLTLADGADRTFAVGLNATGDANAAKALAIHAGNKTAGTGDGGALSLDAGTSAGGSAGAITIGSGAGVSVTITPATTVAGALAANGGITVDTTNFTVNGTSGAVHTAGDFDVATNKFTVASATGNTLVAGTLSATGDLAVNTDKLVVTASTGAVVSAAGITGTMHTATAQAHSVADSLDGNPATSTLTPTSSLVVITCNDADGCTMTMGEGSAAVGQIITIVNTSANAASFADSAGVSELAGPFVMGQYDALSLVYAGSTWIESDRSDN